MTSAVFKNASADKEMLFSQDLPDADFQRCATCLAKLCLQSMQPAVASTQADVLFLMPCLLSRFEQDTHTSQHCTVSPNIGQPNLLSGICLVGSSRCASHLPYVVCYVSDLWLQAFSCIEMMCCHHILRPILPCYEPIPDSYWSRVCGHALETLLRRCVLVQQPTRCVFVTRAQHTT